MKLLVITILTLMVASASGCELKGVYKIDADPILGLSNEEKVWPGVAPWEEKIEFKKAKLIYHIGSRGPLEMDYKVADGKVEAWRTFDGGEDRIIFKITEDGHLTVGGKTYKGQGEPDGCISVPLRSTP